MFEKEAEEWAKEHEGEYISDLMNLEESYKNGAEFGYNKAMNEVEYRIEAAHREGVAFGKDKAKEYFAKQLKEVVEKANEWHYVKDGDLPKHEVDVLVLFNEQCIDIAHYNYDYKEWHFADSIRFDVIAWKEIVLPKEVKENE